MVVMRRALVSLVLPLGWLLHCAPVRFIDEVVAILRDNQVVGLKDLNKFKFEYMAWPDKVSGACGFSCVKQFVLIKNW